MAKVGVLALQGDFPEHLAVLERLGVQAEAIRLPEQLEGLDGLIIPGGESTTISRLLEAYHLLDPLRERAVAGFPLMGTCAGAILMAKTAIGLEQPALAVMDIEVRRNAFGRQVDSFQTELEVTILGEAPVPAVFIRAPTIERVASSVEVLARLPDGTIVAAQQGRLLALAFHPELTPDLRFHRYFLDILVRGGNSPE